MSHPYETKKPTFIGKLVAYHSWAEGRSIVMILLLVFSAIINLYALAMNYDHNIIPWYIALYTYIGVFITLYIASGLSTYEAESDRVYSVVGSFLWPLYAIALPIYWFGYCLFAGSELIYDLNGKLHNIKLPSFPKRKQIKEPLPDQGAYRNLPTVCETCGKEQ